MALMKFEQVSLRRLAEDDLASGNQTKLTQFFDKLTAYYKSLQTEKEKQSFLHRVLEWEARKSNKQLLFQYAYQVDHKEAIELLLETRAYTGKVYPTNPGTNYFKHLEAVFLAPIQKAIQSALSTTFPSVLQKIICDYVQTPIQGTLLLKEEKSESTPKANQIVPDIESAEASLGKKNLKKSQNEERNKYIVSIFQTCFLALLWAAVYVAIMTVLSVGMSYLPLIPLIFFSLAVVGLLVTSCALSIPAFVDPLFNIFDVLSSRHKLAFGGRPYAAGTELNNKYILKALIGLALLSAIAVALGTLALLPPLGLAIPVLACTIGAALVLTSSVTAIGIFGFNRHKEKQQQAQFESKIMDWALTPIPLVPSP